MWFPAQMSLAYGVMVQAWWEACCPWLFVQKPKKK